MHQPKIDFNQKTETQNATNVDVIQTQLNYDRRGNM